MHPFSGGRCHRSRAFPLEPFDLPNARFQVASRIGKLPLDEDEAFGGAT